MPIAALANHHEEAPVPLLNKTIIGSLSASADKMTQLAKAIPEDKFDWSPAEGVATVRGVLSHVAGANYFIGSMLGAKVPAGINPREVGKGANKAELIAAYEASVEFAKAAVSGVSAEAMAEEVEFFGNTVPRAQMALMVADHGHEHLGQMIAYARSNGVVPPWSN